MPEFSIIKKYFQIPAAANPDIIVGIGDDAALVKGTDAQDWVVCVDTLVNGQHFLTDTPAAEIGHRALAVNLSDMAAMGAKPQWFTLALTLPEADEQWLSEFSRGLFAAAQKYQVNLIGGDTTQGHLTISIQMIGTVPKGEALLRNQAQIGDKIFVSGSLGDAGLGLAMLQHRVPVALEYQEYLTQRYQHPTPRVGLGLALRKLANSAIDISDGLAADLNHILEQSHVGAKIFVNDLPLSPALRNTVATAEAYQYALTAGDDYELCFTVPSAKVDLVASLAQQVHIDCTCIGEIIDVSQGLQILTTDGSPVKLEKLGWECL